MGQAAKPTRQNRTITVDFQDEATYFQLLGDTQAFVEFVLAFLLSLGFQLLHKASCSEGGSLPRHSHYAHSWASVLGGTRCALNHLPRWPDDVALAWATHRSAITRSP